MDFLWGAAALIFIKILDTVAYKILAGMYQIFLAVSRINIFATDGGMKIFSDVSTQLYTVIGIAMIFVFAYQLVLLIINPEGGNQKAPSKLFMDTVISMVVVLMLPTIFNYMTVFQDHVLTNGTIPALILGTNAAEDLDEDAGYKIALMVMVSFYHPNNSDYTTFYGEDGELKKSDDAVKECHEENGDDKTTCQTFYDALSDYDKNHTVGSLTLSSTLSKNIYKEETMSYMWVLSTAGALLVAWFLVTYSIDIGTRAVKLGFLQIIAPVPVILRIFPQSRKTFETWFGEIKKTYLEVFIRLAVIFFTVRLIQIVPTLIAAVFDSTSGSGDGIVIKCIATVLLILGLLKFAQEAPELVKTMFNSGGNLLAGMNLKPGVRKHIEDNKLGMAGIGAATGLVGGMIGGAGNAMRTAKERSADGKGRFGSNAGAAIYGGLRGAMTGAVHGAKNAPKDLSKKGLGEGMEASIRSSQDSYNKGTWAEKIIRAGQDAKAEGKGRWKAMIGETSSMISDNVKKDQKKWQERGELIQGVSMGKDQKSQFYGSLGQIIGGMQGIVDSDGKLKKISDDYKSDKATKISAQQSEMASLREMNMQEIRGLQNANAAVLASTSDGGGSFTFSKTFTQADFNAKDPQLSEYLTELSKSNMSAYQAMVQALSQGQSQTVSITKDAANAGAFGAEVKQAKSEYDRYTSELEAMKRNHEASIQEMESRHKADLDVMKSDFEKASAARKTQLYAENKAVADAMRGSMAEIHKMMESSGHQLGESIAAVNKAIENYNTKHGSASPFANISSFQELADVYSKKDAQLPAELTDLLTDIKNEVQLQGSMAARAELKAKQEDKK